MTKEAQLIDPQLELKNFGHAGKILVKIWSEMVVDSYPLIAEYIDDKTSEIVKNVSEKRSHLMFQYSLQIVKCNNITCLRHHVKML